MKLPLKHKQIIVLKHRSDMFSGEQCLKYVMYVCGGILCDNDNISMEFHKFEYLHLFEVEINDSRVVQSRHRVTSHIIQTLTKGIDLSQVPDCVILGLSVCLKSTSKGKCYAVLCLNCSRTIFS